MTDHFDVSTLNWVKGEIDETLKEARLALEKFVDNPEDETQLHFCGTHLHQVAGTLQMVELYGAGQLATEMERLADALPGLEPRDAGLEVLMRSLLLLPDYLEVLQTGQPDSPLILLPLVNELRQARGEPELAPFAVFKPDLNVYPREADLPRGDGDVHALAHKLRPAYQAALVRLLTGKDAANGLHVLANTLDKLATASAGHEARRAFWVGAGLVEALRDGLQLDAPAKQLLGKFEQLIKQIATAGETALDADAVATLVRAALFEIARTPSEGPLVSALKRAYRLDSLVPAPAVLDQIRSGMGGFNAELKQTVSRDVMEDLSRIKDVLDLFSRGGVRASGELQPVAEALSHIADVLGLVRQSELAAKLRERAAQIQTLVQGGQDVEERLLMGVAESVLSVESALSDWGTVSPLEKADDTDGQVTAGESSPEAEAEHRRVVRQVMKVAKEELVKARESVNAFINSPADTALLNGTPRQFRQIIGSLCMLSYKRVAQVLRACQLFVDHDLAGQSALPDGERLDALADAMMSVEYYLDAFVESRVHPSSVLDVAERAVARLGYPVDSLPEELPAPVEQRPADTGESVDIQAEEAAGDSAGDAAAFVSETSEASEQVEAQEAQVEEIAAAPGLPSAAVETVAPIASPTVEPPVTAPPVTAPATEMDEEIVAIFVEEAEEEFQRIAELLPRCRANTSDEESLRELRRSFHTLKGSGRLVGAGKLGEFAWAFENLLNRVIDKTVAPDAATYDLVERARVLMPELLAEFRGGPAPSVDAAALAEAAFALANGTPAVATASPAPDEAPVIDDPVLRDIYTKEAEGHLAGLRNFLAESHGMRMRPSDGLLRSLHTLCGSSRTAGVAPMAELTGILEQYAKAVQAKGHALEPEGLEVLEATADWVGAVLAHLQDARPGLPPAGDLPSRAAALLARAEAADTEAETAATPPMADSQGDIEPDVDASALEIAPEQTPIEIAPLEVEAGDGFDELDALAPPLPQESIDLVAPESENAEPAALAGPGLAESELVETLLRDEPFAEMPPPPAAAPAESSEQAASAELITVFVNEASDLLGSSDELIQQWVENPTARKPVEALQRVLHTLKGSARWAGVAPMVELGHALESAIAAVVEGRVPVDEEVLHLAQRAQSHLEALLAQLKNGDPLGKVNEIVERLKALAAAAPVAASNSIVPPQVREYDADLLNIFLEEGHEILNASDETLQALMADPQDRTLIERLQRHLHTLKGGARMAGVVELGDLGHSFESMLAGAADGVITLTPPMLALMQRAQDRLAVMLEQLRHHDPLPSGADLIAELEALVSGKPPPEQPGDAPAGAREAIAETDARVDTELPHEDGTSAERAAIQDADSSRDRRTGPRPQFELVRVRADLLDNLVNVAGEASIFRSRIEQQVGAVGFNLGEMEQVIERLRDKLRMFDIETEAQIQSRYEEAGSRYEDFDPLEFDRFTHMQQLSRSMMESLGDLSSMGHTLQGITRETETLLVQQARVNTELQEGLMHTRMVPLVQNAPRLRRVVRQACEELGKEAELRFKGAEVEMDRNVVERIMAPLEHLLRNAVAHGIESADQREAAGKPRMGTIVVHQIREGGEVVVKVTDDGAGINVQAVREKAVARGLMDSRAQLSDKEIMSFILESGFSTAEALTQIAGRGVGMDVVNSEVKNLNGTLSIESEFGKATTFTIRLPLTLTVSRALLVYAGEDMYAVPLLSIEGIVRTNVQEIANLLEQEAPVYRWLGYDYDVLHLATVLGTATTVSADGENRRQQILLAHSGDHRIALVVDRLLGSREIVVKPIGRQLGSVRGLSGATILGDGSVALILELPALIRAGLAHRSGKTAPPAPAPATASRKPVVMVVDDSITVRKVTSRLLERNDMTPVSAKDGVEALALLEETVPDVMLLDIEMPRMDGYELATHIRNEPRLQHVPIIMITSRSGDKHRQRAMQIGVDVYMTKPFQENDLLESIHALLSHHRSAMASA
jgi:chemosensory pili system protein ChpA (sensor histidine kinase/response regulator)